MVVFPNGPEELNWNKKENSLDVLSLKIQKLALHKKSPNWILDLTVLFSVSRLHKINRRPNYCGLTIRLLAIAHALGVLQMEVKATDNS